MVPLGCRLLAVDIRHPMNLKFKMVPLGCRLLAVDINPTKFKI
jgi:hypothetical protein